MTTTDDTQPSSSKPSLFERTDKLTGHDEYRVRANFDADVWDTYEAAFARIAAGPADPDTGVVPTRPAPGSQRSLVTLCRMLVFLDFVAEGTQPISAKSTVQGMTAAEVLERYAPDEPEPDPDNPETESGKDDTAPTSTPPQSPGAASPPA